MTKAAMAHMSEALACEWACEGIRVNCVCPWMARTPLLEAAVAKDPSQLDEVTEATPLGRLGEPADTAGAGTTNPSVRAPSRSRAPRPVSRASTTSSRSASSSAPSNRGDGQGYPRSSVSRGQCSGGFSQSFLERRGRWRGVS